MTEKPTVILSDSLIGTDSDSDSSESLPKNLVGWGVTDSGDVGPTSSEESESAPIPIKVADRSLVDLLGKDSSPKSRTEAVPVKESDGMTAAGRPTLFC